MTEPNMRRGGGGSFFGDYLYDSIVPGNHFLRLLRELVPWDRYSRRLLRYYRGKGREGRPPIAPALVLKMLLLCYLYNISERQAEDFCRYYLPAKYFLGLAVDEEPPDHSTLSVFRKRLVENGRATAFERLLRDIIVLARERGIEFDDVQIIDSTHSIADVNVAKDKKRQKDGKEPRDPDSRWGCKGSYKARDANGKTRTVRKYIFGYKDHTSMNAGAQMISSLMVTPANAHDGKYLRPLLQSDLAQGLPVGACTADRGYDDTENHLFLQQQGINDAVLLNDYRTQKKDSNKQVWIELKSQPWYDQTRALRYQVERKFGEAKKHHGLGRCRYTTLMQYTAQAYLTALALNLKQLVRGLTGVSLKSPTLIRC